MSLMWVPSENQTANQNSVDQNDMREFYKTVNAVRRKTTPSPVTCNDLEGNLLTDKNMVAARWREHFDVVINTPIQPKRFGPLEQRFLFRSNRNSSFGSILWQRGVLYIAQYFIILSWFIPLNNFIVTLDMEYPYYSSIQLYYQEYLLQKLLHSRHGSSTYPPHCYIVRDNHSFRRGCYVSSRDGRWMFRPLHTFFYNSGLHQLLEWHHRKNFQLVH